MAVPATPFAQWLNAAMQSHSLSQAEVARTLGVADVQVSRWRRGQVVPSVRYLQQIAEVFGVPRATLDRLAGYPGAGPPPRAPEVHDVAREAELQACQARLGHLLAARVPQPLWGAYLASCEALAEALAKSFGAPDDPARAAPPAPGGPPEARPLGFRHRARDGGG